MSTTNADQKQNAERSGIQVWVELMSLGMCAYHVVEMVFDYFLR